MAQTPLDSQAKQAVVAATEQLRTEQGSVALKQGAALAREIADQLCEQEQVDPAKLHDRVTR